ncbi:hypothetical protein ACH518_17850 [Methylomonas sp. HW2-6]|uniref:hypothetical protein n=1 Tax=Methylomonas sp. HW2-6 TaxID=3376687 RepID=UPI004042998C
MKNLIGLVMMLASNVVLATSQTVLDVNFGTLTYTALTSAQFTSVLTNGVSGGVGVSGAVAGKEKRIGPSGFITNLTTSTLVNGSPAMSGSVLMCGSSGINSFSITLTNLPAHNKLSLKFMLIANDMYSRAAQTAGAGALLYPPNNMSISLDGALKFSQRFATKGFPDKRLAKS